MNRKTRNEKLSALFAEDYRVIDFLPFAVSEKGSNFLRKQRNIFSRISSWRIFATGLLPLY